LLVVGHERAPISEVGGGLVILARHWLHSSA
jgi:hypothetical protein